MIQISNIVLYSRWGDVREVKLKKGDLNIITGKSKTGKSSLAPIIEYIFGSDDFRVSMGKIQQTVSWYGAVLESGDSKLFVARPDPGAKDSTGAMYLQVLTDTSAPKFTEMKANTSRKEVRSRLSAMCGVAPNSTEVPEKDIWRAREASVAQALFLCIQEQDVLGSKEMLFHRQSEEKIPTHIRDTFPYFIGAIDDDRSEKLSRLRNLRRQIRAIRGDIDELAHLRASRSARIDSLLDEALSTGLLNPGDRERGLETLCELSKVEAPAESSSEEDPTAELRHSRNIAISRREDLNSALRIAKRYREEQGGFESEARQQITRLKAVNLYSATDSAKCPICDQTVDESAVKAHSLSQSIRELDRQLGSAAVEEPRIQKYIEKIQTEMSDVSREIDALDLRIDALHQQYEFVREQRSRDLARGRVLGRISIFIESLAQVASEDGSESLGNKLEKLQKQASLLEVELDEEALRERLSTILSSLSRQIGGMADQFELEHKGLPVRFDLSRLTLTIEENGKFSPLLRVGSAENHIGYHLAFFLSLHRFLRETDRPVPAFLFIDQPTQAYFPPDSDMAGKLAELREDDDREAVRRMYRIMKEVVESLAPKLQIIVTDHADLSEDWFQEKVVHRWRDRGLIPLSWIERAEIEGLPLTSYEGP